MAPKRSAAPRARTAARALSRPPGVVRALAPSRHSLAVGLALLALAGGAYAAARETSAFAVRRVEVTGGTPEVRAQVQRDLASVVGTSLVGLDGARLVRHVEALPTVVSAVYDRDFPHTLRVSIVPETSVAVLHQGRQTWLVSARGRVVAHVPQRTFPLLPRIWVPAATPVTAGAFLGPAVGGTVARSLAVALAARFPARIATAAFQRDGLVFRLRSGLELRLGDPSDVRLKLAIARRALDQLPAGTVYLDVSVPGRPVTGINPKLSALG
ncbi:MAG TPA: FtsQ-type POTRA domain-containing protein [Gaiellaceae bacterium]